MQVGNRYDHMQSDVHLQQTIGENFLLFLTASVINHTGIRQCTMINKEQYKNK